MNAAKHFMSAILVAIFLIIAYGSDDNSSNSVSSPKSERQIEIEKHFDVWDGSHIELTKYIKENMNDPDSYEHIETKYTDYGSYIFVVTRFRGANAFGGKVINSISAKIDNNGNILEVIENN